MSIGKWRIVGILMIGAGLAAALPFQRAGQQPRSIAGKPRQPDFVWRRPDARSEAAVETGHSPAAELFIHQLTEEAEADEEAFPQVQRHASLDSPAPPPRLPAAYEPLVEPEPEAFTPQDGAPIEVESRVVRHRIEDGDTLAQLAARYLASADRWQEIFDENRDLLESPDLLPIDGELVIQVRRGTAEE